ncbi:hypothetical protein K488DRAFT_90004 [Vararia minispora EC-137]|uniref:Uncharacterized protein n=1 Tax=Vararia minispora EC-137 TaxID=1314806 RepID=A0ACB8Q9H8_9AGAM|nr:hypothetical protein K488DRAFT_90004 [Vararia minispora EC-137]
MKDPRPSHLFLPPELWFAIFNLATFVPHSLDPDVVDPFVTPRTFGFDTITFALDLREEICSVRSSLHTKSVISRVCWTWHNLAVPLLYEVISIKRDSDVIRLNQLLKQSQIPVSDGSFSHNFSWYTRRFDLALPREHFLADPTVVASLVELIRQFSQLEISYIYLSPKHTGDNRCYTPCDIVDAFRITCSGTLRKLVWQSALEKVQHSLRHGHVAPPSDAAAESFLSLVKSAPNLCTLVYTPFHYKGHYAFINTSASSHKFVFACPTCSKASRNPIESHELFVHPPDDHWDIVAQQDGATQTTYVTAPFHHPITWQLTRGPSEQSGDTARQIILFWHSTLHFAGTRSFVILIQQSPIVRLGLHFGFMQARNAFYRTLREWLAGLALRLPALRVVRIMNGHLVQDLTQKHRTELARIVRGAEGWPFVLEDHLGRRLQVYTRRPW